MKTQLKCSRLPLQPGLWAMALTVAGFSLLLPLQGVQVNQQGLQIQWLTAAAQENEEAERPRTRRAMAISENVNRKLASVSEKLNPEEGGERDLRGALQELLEINHSRWNEYERAQVYNMLGGVYVELENYDEATKYYQLFYDTPSLPDNQRLNVSFTLAQLYMVAEKYKEAINLLENYIANSEIVGGNHYFTLGQVYYQDGQLDKALPNIDKAIQMFEESDRLPKESWYQYQYALYFEKENFKKVISILEKMVRHYPKMQTWKVLAQVYGADGRAADQRHAFEAIYQMGGLTEEKQLVVLASLYLEADYPYKAAKVLEKGIADNIVEATSKNLQTLGIAWNLARENDKSIPVMEQAAKKSEDGELYARLSRIYLSSDDYQNSVNAANEALKRSLKKPADVHLTLGMAYFNMEEYDDALNAFREARKNKEVQKDANTWIAVTQNEKERAQKLAASE